MALVQETSVLSAPQLAEGYARNLHILKRQLDGLGHADTLVQPPVRGNCLNWILGHLAVHRDYALAALGEPPTLDATAAARYGSGSDPVLADGPGVLPLETLLSALDLARERLAAALGRADADALARELPNGGRVAAQVFGLYFHETYRTGQAELLRQLAGKDDKVL